MTSPTAPTAPAGTPTPLPEELVAGLEPADVDWVSSEAARYQSARALPPEQYRELVRQLVMVRQFDVVERQEPMAPQEQP